MTVFASDPSPTSADRFWAVWLALLPVLPPLALLGIFGLGRWKVFSKVTLALLGSYSVAQLVAALLSPQPLLATFAALMRTALLAGLLALGTELGSAHRLRTLRWGLIVVYLTALLNGLALQGWNLTQLRLTHPYYTPVSLALAGAVGLWLALAREDEESWFSGLTWRLPLGGLAAVTMLLSGSRGPLLTALAGTLILMAFQTRRTQGRWKVGALAGALTVVTILSGALLGRQSGVLQRLGSLDLTGRDLIWNDALSTVQAFPWSGAGTLLLGPRIAPPGGQCTWFEALEVRGIGCPHVVEQFNNAWVIAHNGALQALGETGLIGTAGLFLLLGAALAAATRARPLIVTLLVGLLLADLTDNVTLLPGPFFSEIFWLAAGWALAQWKVPQRTAFPAAASWGAAALLITAFPVWASFIPSRVMSSELQRTGLIAPTQWRSDEPYAAAAQFQLPAGAYRAQLRACRVTCVTVATKAFEVEQGTSSAWQWLIGPLPTPAQVDRAGTGHTAPAGQYQMQLRLWPGLSAPWRTRPLATEQWQTAVKQSEAKP